jgi:hypothetical protein
MSDPDRSPFRLGFDRLAGVEKERAMAVLVTGGAGYIGW